MRIATIVEALVEAGASPEQILAAVRAAEASIMAEQAKAAEAAAAKAEHRRELTRERVRRHRAVKRDVTDGNALQGVSNVTSSPPDGPLSPNPSPPLNPPATGSAGQGARATGFDPEASLWRRCIDALGDMAGAGPGMMISGEIEAVVAGGVDVEADLLPALSAKAEDWRRRGKRPFATWQIPLEAAIEARDRRLSMAAAAKRPPKTAAPENRSDRYATHTDGPFGRQVSGNTAMVAALMRDVARRDDLDERAVAPRPTLPGGPILDLEPDRPD